MARGAADGRGPRRALVAVLGRRAVARDARPAAAAAGVFCGLFYARDGRLGQRGVVYGAEAAGGVVMRMRIFLGRGLLFKFDA